MAKLAVLTTQPQVLIEPIKSSSICMYIPTACHLTQLSFCCTLDFRFLLLHNLIRAGLATCPTELISSDEMVENVLQVYPHILITILLYGGQLHLILPLNSARPMDNSAPVNQITSQQHQFALFTELSL
jgi:hypothetical protein